MYIAVNYERINTLPFDIVLVTHNCAFHNSRMHVDGILNFRGANAVTTYIEHIIYPACYAVVSVFVFKGSITCEIQILVSSKVVSATAFMVTIGCT